MAIFEQNKRNGIQYGKHLDVCEVCYGPGSKYEYGEQEYKEIFKLHINGLEYCICMEHFQEMLGDYVLVHKDSLKEEDILTINESDTVEQIDEKVSKKKGKK